MMRAMTGTQDIDGREVSRRLIDGGCDAAKESGRKSAVRPGGSLVSTGTGITERGHRCVSVGDVVHVRYVGHVNQEADMLLHYSLILDNCGYRVQEEADDANPDRRRLAVWRVA